jgi:hypothetical protein
MREISLDLFKEGDRKETSVRQEKSLMESRAALEKKVIEKGETTFRIISKSVREYQFTIPYNLSDTERVEVGQIFSVHDGGLTFFTTLTMMVTGIPPSKAPSSSTRTRSLIGS